MGVRWGVLDLIINFMASAEWKGKVFIFLKFRIYSKINMFANEVRMWKFTNE